MLISMPPKIQFKLKTVPSDFAVEEIAEDKAVFSLDAQYSFGSKIPENLRENGKGLKFLHFVLQKENRDTLETLSEIAQKLHAPRDAISVAGMKDKRAVTSQLASAYKIRKEQMEELEGKIRGVKLIPLRYSERKVFLGNLWGNRFTIAARGIDMKKDTLRALLEARIKEMSGFFPNYFGEQRFGEDKSTSQIGKLILRRDFENAAKLCAEKYRECDAHLKNHPKDRLGAIKQLPLKLQKMFIHAVQAEIFNATLDEVIARNLRDTSVKIPLPGYAFASRIFTSETDRIAEEILAKEGIAPEMFRVEALPQIASKGELRRAFEEFHDFKILGIEADELNTGKTKAVLQFSLKKGCYATVFLEHVFKG